MLWVLIRIHNIGFYEVLCCERSLELPDLAQAILMSTHNIGFYEDLTKIIFQLSSNMHIISSSGFQRKNGNIAL